MFYVFDDSQILFVIASAFLLGFLPLLILMWRTPEARKFITCMIKGGSIIASADDSGQVEIEIATPYGEGQFRAGKNVYGQRKIYTKPRINNPFINKPSILKGLRRPIFFNYAGKTTITNLETIAACEVAEATANEKAQEVIPAGVQQWANEHHISLLEITEPAKPATPTAPATPPKIELITYPLWNVSPLKLKEYFSRSMDPGQIDVLLEKENLDGFRQGRGTGPNMGKIGLVIVAVAIVGIVLMVALKGFGVI